MKAEIDMTTNARLLIMAIGVATLVASTAMAKTHNVPTTHNQGHAARSQVEHAPRPTFDYESPYQFQGNEGYQHDRQMVGHGMGGGPEANE
jgi:hypothetical protein